MATYLKKVVSTAETGQEDARARVAEMLGRLRDGGDAVALEYALSLDGMDGPVVITCDEMEEASRHMPQDLQDDIAHDNIRRFAEAQHATIKDTEPEVRPGFIAGQRTIPMSAAGAYVPGGVTATSRPR